MGPGGARRVPEVTVPGHDRRHANRAAPIRSVADMHDPTTTSPSGAGAARPGTDRVPVSDQAPHTPDRRAAERGHVADTTADADTDARHARRQGTALRVSGLTKRFGRTKAIDGVDLHVAHGEVVGLLGANGAGKSTLVSTIVGLRTPDAGEIRLLDLDPVRDRRALRRLVGVQLQGAVFHDALTVRELLTLHVAFHDDPYPVDELLDLVDLTAKARTRVEHLSGGQHQRLALAVALVGRPRFLVLDELSTGLDPAARARIRTRIERIRDDGATILLVSHDMEEVTRLCDRVIVLADGRVVADATPAALIGACRAQHENVRTLGDAFLVLTGTEPTPDDDAEDDA